MRFKHIFPFFLIFLVGCSKSQIKKNGCTGPGYYIGQDSCNIHLNNLFTPNGDGFNETFPESCDCSGSTDFLLEVKTGNKVLFSTTKPKGDNWDGTYKGKEVKEGVYDWTLTYTLENNLKNFEGNITLIRDITEPIDVEGSCVFIFTDPIVVY